MVGKNKEAGKLTAVIASLDERESEGKGLTGPQIALAYKAALSDFVLRKTNRAAIAEVSKLLAGALQARRQELSEDEDLSSHKIHSYY